MKKQFICIILFWSLAMMTDSASGGLKNRGCSYYPRDYGWDRLWLNADETFIAQDFQELASLGCNYVRIVIRPHVCGFNGNYAQWQQFKHRLDSILELADRNGLWIQLVLFDHLDASDFRDIMRSKTWIDSIVAPYAASSIIKRWELLSEINLVYKSMQADSSKVLDWYQEVFPHLMLSKGVNQEATVSVGVVGKYEGEHLFFQKLIDRSQNNPPTVYSLVYTRYAFLFPAFRQAIQQIIGDKPLVIAELGWDTYTKSELFQKDQCRNAFFYFEQCGIEDVAIWTLWDFKGQETVPELVFEEKQRYFGLRRADGSYKPAYDVVYRTFHDLELDYSISNSSFELFHDLLMSNNPVPASTPDCWIEWPSEGASGGEFRTTAAQAFSGSHALQFVNTGAAPMGAFYEQGIPVIPNYKYRLQAFVKMDGDTGQSIIEISWLRSHTNDQATHLKGSGSSLSRGYDWTKLAVIADAPEGAALAQPFCKSQNNRLVYFDQISFSRLLQVPIQVDATIRDTQTDSIAVFYENCNEPDQSAAITLANTVRDTLLISPGWYKPMLIFYCSYNSPDKYGRFAKIVQEQLRLVDSDSMQSFVFMYTPADVVQLAASAGADSVVLSWRVPGTLFSRGFEINRRESGNSSHSIGYVPATSVPATDYEYHFIDRDLKPGKYRYLLKQIEWDGSEFMSEEVEVVIQDTPSFTLTEAYPNPCNSATMLNCNVPVSSWLSLFVYDANGRQVRTLINEQRAAGNHKIIWDGRNDGCTSVASGLYFAEMVAGDCRIVRKIILIR